jgi:Zn-finger nucleic acid-binding protein
MALACPRCKNVDLEEIELRDVLIDRCPRCAGLWFDNAELGEITGMRAKLKGLESIIPESQFSDDSVHCPRCEGIVLRELNVEDGGRTHSLFRCVSCMGTWLDRGSLRAQEDGRLIDALKGYFMTLP